MVMVMQEKGDLPKAMNAKIIGSGSETIVLAHGYGGNQSVWEKVVPCLVSKNFQVLVFDWTFSGAVKDQKLLFDPEKYSTYEAFASDLIGLMDEMNLRSSVLVGHSMSGMIACIASTKRPDLFKRLVLVGASPRPMVMVMQEKGDLPKAMNAKIIGSGSETIVLAHGYGGDQSVWEKVVPCLVSKNFQVLVFDWTFSGAVKDQKLLFDPEKYSTYEAFASDLIGLMDEMNLRSSVLVGHSMSGMIACIASTKRPDLFKRLVLVGASPRYINTDGYEGGFDATQIDELMSNIESNYHNWTSAFASLVVDAGDPPSVAKFTGCLRGMDPEVALSLAKTVFYSDQRDMLDKVTVPCTIVQTTNDVIVPSSVAFYMQERIKGKSTVQFIDADGHFPQLTAHLQFFDVLTGVLEVYE